MDAMQNPSDPAGQLDQDPDLNLGIELQDDLEGDTLREECGVFGIFGHPEAAAITALGLHALQHRGQEAAGIVSFDGSRFHSERRLGLVGDTFSRREVIDRLPGNAAVGHVRYSTTGGTILRNVQPLFAELSAGGFAVGHNGNLTNGLSLRRELVKQGLSFQTKNDSEVAAGFITSKLRGGSSLEQAMESSLGALDGFYTFVIGTKSGFGVLRDPIACKPAVMAETERWVAFGTEYRALVDLPGIASARVL